MAPRTQARAYPRPADGRPQQSDETLAFPRWRRPMRILITTDAWAPQVNGVVRTLETLGKELVRLGHDVRFVTPDGFRTIPMPTYPEIKLALFARRAVGRVIDTFKPDAIHIATEGPLGLATRRNCMRRGHFIHDVVPHALSRIHPRTLRRADGLAVCGSALVSWAGNGRDGGDAHVGARFDGARVQESAAVVARRRYGLVQTGGEGLARSAAAGVSVCRARCDREERRGILEARLARIEAGRRRRAAACRIARTLSAGSLRRTKVRSRARAVLWRERRVRLPLAHRHVRACRA